MFRLALVRAQGNGFSPNKSFAFGQARCFQTSALILEESKRKTTPQRSASARTLQLATQIASFKGNPDDPHCAVSVPIYQTATFDCNTQEKFDYTRSGNPTRNALQQLVSKIENAHSSYAFTSGMAALTSVMRLLQPGDKVVACCDIYGGMHRLLQHTRMTSGIEVHFVNTWELDKVEQLLETLDGNVKMMCVESPTNPQMRVSNIRALADLIHEKDGLLCVDSSVMSPVLMTPLDLQADIVVHSATKFMSGHSDVMAGVVSVRDPEIAQKFAFIQNAEGSGLSPFDSWLVLRGLKTMVLRVKAAQSSAVEIAEFLDGHPAVSKVHYLMDSRSSSDPETALHFSQAKGGGAVLSFETGSVEFAKSVIKSSKLFKNTVSFGSVSSLMEIPALMSHASIPIDQQTMAPDLIRLSVGLEDPSDLIRDLSDAFVKASKETNFKAAQQSVGTRTLPLVKKLPLGVSLPPRDAHAVGVSMPQWNDVVAYEEGCEITHGKLESGYPRFVYLAAIKRLFAKADELFAQKGEQSMVVPSARVGLRLQRFLTKAGVPNAQCHDFFAHGVFAVTYPIEHAALAKAFWQHCGEIVSSRLAEAVLDVVNQTCYENNNPGRQIDNSDGENEKNQPKQPKQSPSRTHNNNRTATSEWGDDHRAKDRITALSPHDALRRRIAALVDEDRQNVYMYPTGMAAITAAHRLLQLSSQWEDAPLRTVVFGFPYLDTLKVAGRPELGSGVVFFGNGDDDDFEQLEQLLKTEAIGGLLCEFPSNPLLKSPDLGRLRTLADKYHFPIVVDDTIGGFCNIDVLQEDGADILVSSLTKQFAGSGNVMGGSLVLNSNSPMHTHLHARLSRDYEELLWSEDAAQLLKMSWDMEHRMAGSNNTAALLVDWLDEHPLVKEQYYPSKVLKPLYEKYMRQSDISGYGGLFSVVFHDPRIAREFYDNLEVAKGPGFGTNFSLACPYTQLAHYGELEYVERFGVDPNLVRVWVGLEDFFTLRGTFESALEQAGEKFGLE